MDFKRLITKIDQLESKKILTESTSAPTSRKQGASYHLVESLGLSKKPQVNESSMGSIARALLEEFGLNEATNPWPAGSEKATAWDSLTDEDREWLGGADPTDEYILMRAPNKGAQRIATQQPAPDAAPPAAQQPAPAMPDTATSTAAGEDVGRKIQRFKDLLAQANTECNQA